MKSIYKKELILIYINSKKNKNSIELTYLLGYSHKQLDYILKGLEKDGDIFYNNKVTRLKLTEQGKEYLRKENLLKIKYQDLIL